MKITTKPVTMLVVDDIMKQPHRLDPVRIICENPEPGRGRIILTCFDAAWVGYWGAMGGRTIEQFFIDSHAVYLAENMMSVSSLRGSGDNSSLLVCVITAAQEALRARQPKITRARAQRLARLKHVNALVKVISDHGRRFFWNEKDQRLAKMEMDARGRLWWIDDYRGARISIEKIGGYEHRWNGFSHGGTLMSLVQDMREYVKNDTLISLWKIAPDCWGYDAEAAAATTHAACGIECCIPF